MIAVRFGLLLLGVGMVMVIAGCKATRGGYETAPYSVAQAHGRFEVRDYPALTVVETPVQGAVGTGSDGGFRRLFRFITGSNESGEKIAMTTPVYMGGTPASPTMAFVMPAEVAARKVPRPTDDQVTVNTIPPGRFAVLRYSGRRTPAKESSAAARLREWMEQERLPSQGTPVLAYFDPPWTPAFLRRNEVMIRIRADAP